MFRCEMICPVGKSNSRSNVFQLRRTSTCVPSRWKVLSGEFRRPHDGCTLMHGLKCGSCRFWQRTDSPPGSNMLRAEIQRALRRAPRQLRRLARLANSPGFKSFRCPRWRIKFSLERYSDYVAHSFAYPAAGKFSRASSAGGRRHLQ